MPAKRNCKVRAEPSGFILNAQRMQVRGEPRPNACQPCQTGMVFVSLESVSLGLVLGLGLATDRAARQNRRNHAAREVVERQRCSGSVMKDRRVIEPATPLVHVSMTWKTIKQSKRHPNSGRAMVGWKPPARTTSGLAVGLSRDRF